MTTDMDGTDAPSEFPCPSVYSNSTGLPQTKSMCRLEPPDARCTAAFPPVLEMRVRPDVVHQRRAEAGHALTAVRGARIGTAPRSSPLRAALARAPGRPRSCPDRGKGHSGRCAHAHRERAPRNRPGTDAPAGEPRTPRFPPVPPCGGSATSACALSRSVAAYQAPRVGPLKRPPPRRGWQKAAITTLAIGRPSTHSCGGMLCRMPSSPEMRSLVQSSSSKT